MSKNRQRREDMFDLYSDNFSIVRGFIKLNVNLPQIPLYVCPLCLWGYPKEVLDSSDELTLEHIIPEKMGGKNATTILTCKICNNSSGVLEGKFIESEVTKNAMSGINGSSTRVEYSVEINENTIRLPFTYRIDGDTHVLEGIKKQTNFKALEKLNEYGIEKIQEFNLTFNIENRRHGNPAIALLKIAYLMLFRVFGYGAIFTPNMNKIREQIISPKEQIINFKFIDGSKLPDKCLGILFVNSPPEKQCILVTFELEIGKVQKRYSIVLPNTENPGLKIYNNLQDGEKINMKYTHVTPDLAFLNDPMGVLFAREYWQKQVK